MAKKTNPRKPSEKPPPKTTNRPAPRIGHIVSHTHWDREWRYPIWETRMMLVDFMEELITLLEKGVYPGFLLDGQVAPVLDYLEMRPAEERRIKKLVKSGKLEIGPWYILPDEYPVDGEALVRNLLMGRAVAERFGGVFNIGYTPFGWGQTAQLGQIYAGFGMDVAMIGKRVDKKTRAPQCEFLWRAPDGTELLATRFGEWGRQNFYFYYHLPILYGMDHFKDWDYHWKDDPWAWHRADRERMEQDHFTLKQPADFHRAAITQELIENAWSSMDESLMPDDRLMMNGCDYSAAQPLMAGMIAALNDADEAQDRAWVHTTMTKYVQLMREQIVRRGLRVVEGELRDGPANDCTANALTSRLYLKAKNKYAQNMLIRFAEPMTHVAGLVGAPVRQSFLDLAWKNLVDSHPHDSINAVTQDKTARDVEGRLDQVIDLAQTAGERALQELTKRIDTSAFDREDALIVVFNPLPYARRSVEEAFVNIEGRRGDYVEWPHSFEAFEIVGHDGKKVSSQWEGLETELYPVAELHTRAFPYKCLRHRIFFDAGEIPAGGYKVFKVRFKDETHPAEGTEWQHLMAQTSTMLTTPTSMENEFLRVEMNPNGTFDMTDKRTGQIFEGLNEYIDRGEHGIYWINRRPMFDEVHSSRGCQARIWAAENGPVRTTLVSEVTMMLPRRGIRGEQRRSEALEPFTIRTAVTLKKGAGQVDITVSFENRHEDHYLKALFPTGIANATHSDAGGHFIVDRRPIRVQGPSEDSVWRDMSTLPTSNFVDVSDGNTGFAVLHDCLMEYEVFDNGERTLALSLLRAVWNWLPTERAGSVFPSQKGSQCLGHHELRYAIRPHAGNWRDANLPRAAEEFNVPNRLVQAAPHEGELPGTSNSLFEIVNPEMRFSALKKAENGDNLILRLYNPTDRTVRSRVRFAAPIRQAWTTDLKEDRTGELKATKSGTVTVTAAAKKIVTVELEF